MIIIFLFKADSNLKKVSVAFLFTVMKAIAFGCKKIYNGEGTRRKIVCFMCGFGI